MRNPYVPLFALFFFTYLLHRLILFCFDVSFQKATFHGAYLGNLFIGVLMVLFLIRAIKRYQYAVAWLYLVASAIKIVLFLWTYKPLLMRDGMLSIEEKTSFLIPYFTVLVLETYFLAQKLNKL